MLILVAANNLSGCTTSFGSACEELTVTRRGDLNSMQRLASSAQFERHVILIETGTGMASTCRSYYIDGDEYRRIPESLRGLCAEQAVGDGGREYCMLYYVDGDFVKERVL